MKKEFCHILYLFISDFTENAMQLRYVLIREVMSQRGETLCVSAHRLLLSLKPVAFPTTTTQDRNMKGGKQQGRHNNGPTLKTPQVNLKRHKGSLTGRLLFHNSRESSRPLGSTAKPAVMLID